jgi:hypothetical protein
MLTSCTLSAKAKSLFIMLLIFSSVYSVNSFSMESPAVVAQNGDKSNGNEILKAIEGGADLKGMTKKQITDSYGEPYSINTDPEKGRYDEKWTYSCETHNGLTYDCVMLYFMTDHVVSVESF